MLSVRTATVALAALLLACGDGRIKKHVEPDAGNPRCGDGEVTESTGEECDGSNFNGQSCSALGFNLGALSCSADCKLVTSQCVKFCGNGALDVGEDCDGTEGPLSCADWGYKQCTDTCKVDALHCRAASFEAQSPLPRSSGGPTLLTDLAPEGRGDLVAAVPGFSGLDTFAYDLTAGFPANRTLSISNKDHIPVLAIAADVDGDGHQDLASINEDGSATRYRFTGTQFVNETLSAPATSADGGVAMCAVSAWAGALSDRLVALGCPGATGSTTSDAVVVYPGGAQVAQALQIVPGEPLTCATTFGTDTVLAATSTAKLYVLHAPAFTVEAPIDLPLPASRIAAADLDGDGDADLVIQSSANIVVLENQGNGFAERRTEAGTASAIVAADLDLDGKADFAWVESGAIQVRRNLGAFTFKALALTTGAGTPLSLAAGDFEGDGDPDLAATVSTSTSSNATTTYLFENKVR